MNLAIMLDNIGYKTQKLINEAEKQHSLCVFMPEQNSDIKIDHIVRTYNRCFDVAALQRYDAVVFMAEKNWDILLPFITHVKGVVIISSENKYYNEISKYTQYIISDYSELNAFLDSMPEHILWFDRNENEIMSRVNSVGLLTQKFLETYKKVYYIGREKNNECNKN